MAQIIQVKLIILGVLMLQNLLQFYRSFFHNVDLQEKVFLGRSVT